MSGLEELFAGRYAAVLTDAVAPALLAHERRRLRAASFTPYRLADRGRYHYCDDAPADALLAALRAAAAAATGRSWAYDDARALRLGPGDYLLAHHDRPHRAAALELMLDLSEIGVPGAEVHYWRGGRTFFQVASIPDALSIVECGPTVCCHHGYISKRLHAAAVTRLLVRLR